ncbi:ABC-F family ATP-binding cassette domain-containing protein [Malacoplasma muris]|uniref:ABC-F family ATP-binding cassette domain-containing protein n=1 Tax=Malacoplasma muris TaxID=2119 RepID=UPI00398F28E9
MSIITVKNLSHSFGEKEIFKNAEFKLTKGEHIGLIGQNGRGKSTFMKILANEFSPDEIDIYRHPKVRIGYMDQHTKLEEGKTVFETLKSAFNWMIELEQEMIDLYEQMTTADDSEQEKLMTKAGDIQNTLSYNGYYEIEEKIKQVSSGLGVDSFGYDTDVSKLSGGQRTKILLCKLLLEAPDVLLLDEPTNFLDEKHIEWLRNYLINYENAFVIISHDVPFINSLINVVYHFESYKMVRYKGNYDNFIKVYELEHQKTINAYNRQQDVIQKMETFIAKNKARASTTGRAKSRQKMLDKIERIELPPTNKPANFNFTESKAPSKIVLNVNDVITGYNQPLSNKINFQQLRNEKIVIIGANGIGKTTLLKTLISEIKPLDGTIVLGDYVNFGYFKQEDKYDDTYTCFEYAWNNFPFELRTQQYIRKELAKVGLSREHIESKVKNLSGGEQAKLRLSILINNPSNVLVLDEPTNHLDKESKNNLKKALIDYNGTLIFVCHEPEFYKGLATKVFDASEWSLIKK